MRREQRTNQTPKYRVSSFTRAERYAQAPARRSRAGLIGRLLLVFTALWSGACGYQFSGRSDQFPRDVQTVFIESFINKTRDVGIGTEITSALKSEFYRKGQLRVVERPEQADAVLSGVIGSFDGRVASVNRRDEVLQYEAILTVDAALRRRDPDEILWRGQGTRVRELYAGSRAAIVTTSSDFATGTLNPADVRRMTDIQLTETENREVRERLVERFARELHQRLMELF